METNKQLIKQISKIPIGQTNSYPLNKWVRLEVKRNNSFKYTIQQNDSYMGWMAPLLILKVKDESTFAAYPIINLKALLAIAFLSPLVFYISKMITDVSGTWYIFLLCGTGFMLAIQIILLPIMYLKLLAELKRKLVK